MDKICGLFYRIIGRYDLAIFGLGEFSDFFWGNGFLFEKP